MLFQLRDLQFGWHEVQLVSVDRPFPTEAPPAFPIADVGDKIMSWGISLVTCPQGFPTIVSSLGL